MNTLLPPIMNIRLFFSDSNTCFRIDQYTIFTKSPAVTPVSRPRRRSPSCGAGQSLTTISPLLLFLPCIFIAFSHCRGQTPPALLRSHYCPFIREVQSSRRRGRPLRPSAEPYVRRYRIRLFAKLYGILYPVNIHLDLWPSHRVLLKHHVELFKIHTRTLTSPIEPFE